MHGREHAGRGGRGREVEERGGRGCGNTRHRWLDARSKSMGV